MIEIVSWVDEGLGNSSYLVDIGDGRALVVDPNRDPTSYLALAESRGFDIAYSAETHLHADFISGSRELAAHGATVIASSSGGLEFPHKGLSDGAEVDLGGLTLRAIGTPGHTPEHLSYLILDGEQPQAVFSGGALLPGSVARTDLIHPDQTEPLARELYRSVRDKLLTLPDDLTVYPTHGGGSFCSSPAGGERTTTIGRERAYNALLNAPDEESFIGALGSSLGSYPTYFLRLREINRRGPKIYGGIPSLEKLAVPRVRELMSQGVHVIDVRPVKEFAAGHIPGSVSIYLRSSFASWLGWLIPQQDPSVFVIGDTQDRQELVRQCLKIGYENLAGELEGGIAAWVGSGLQLNVTPVVTADRVSGAVLDVRQDSEFESGHVPGAMHAELGSLRSVAGSLPKEAITVMCAHGERAMTGASILEREGFHDIKVLDGGPSQWSAARGQPLSHA